MHQNCDWNHIIFNHRCYTLIRGKYLVKDNRIFSKYSLIIEKKNAKKVEKLKDGKAEIQ
jgi:hypothetical protein